MNVLFLCPNLQAGGAERVWSILVPGLRARGYDARLIVLEGYGPFVNSFVRSKVPHEVLGMRHRADLTPLFRSLMLRHFVPEVVVTQGVNALYVGCALARWRRASVIFNDHRQVDFDLSSRHEAMVRLARRWIDLVVAVTLGQTHAWLRRGYPRERIRIVPNGVERNEIDERRESIRRELVIPEEAIVAVVVASLRPEKRLADFVKVIQRVRSHHDNVVGLIVGDGPDRLAINELVHGDQGIRLLGHRTDVPRILKAADVFVLPSEYEAAPMAVLEAMAAALPVLATDVGGVSDMVQHEKTGLLISPGALGQMQSSLAKLIHDPDLRRAMGQAGAHAHSQRFAAEKMIDAYANIITEVSV